MGSWDNHRDAKEFSRMERISMGLANFGTERCRRRNESTTEYAETVQGMRTARGGSTPAKKEKSLTWSEKRSADKILREGKSKRGKK